MQDLTQHGIGCTEFDTLLSDAIDGTLPAQQWQAFEAHRNACGDCKLLFEHAKAGFDLLHSLEEAEPPAYLVTKILNQTTETAPVMSPEAAKSGKRSWLSGLLAPIFRPVMQPRFAMNFGMAFFSVSLLLNVGGVKMGDLRNIDLRPSSLKSAAVRQYNTASARVVKYYENMRFVYEIESRVREIRGTEAQAEQPVDEQRERPDNETSEQPQRKQNQRVRSGEVMLAGMSSNRQAKATDPAATFANNNDRDLGSAVFGRRNSEKRRFA
jgi:hypothetical protein